MAQSNSRFSSQEKAAVVLRLLKGEEPRDLAKELDVTVERLNRWKDVFIVAGKTGLEQESHKRSSASKKRRQQLIQWAALIAALLIGVAAIIRFVTSLRAGGNSG